MNDHLNDHLGIFLNNTNSQMKYEVNINNFLNLYKDFDYIIIVDINNDYSLKLKNYITEYINIKNDYDSNEKIRLIKYISDESLYTNDDFYLIKIKTILKTVENLYFKDINIENTNENINFQYITFINDKYIYTNSIGNYLNYVSNHNLDFSSFLDSSHNTYHYELFVFTINYKNITLLNDTINNDNFRINTLHEKFDLKMPYLKLAYLNNNYNTNIFYNDILYKLLYIKNILPIIEIDKLIFLKNNYNYEYEIFNEIPENFDLEIYKKNVSELKDLNDILLKKNFINQGQYLYKNYSSSKNYINYVLPEFLREYLDKEKLLKYFDVPDCFNVFKYKEYNPDLSIFNETELVIHWLNYGYNENRKYF